jgi:epoxide hydrolase-like predicted phosphatase
MKKILFFIFSLIASFSAIHAAAPKQVLVFDFGGVLYESKKEPLHDFVKKTFHVGDEGLQKIRKELKDAHAAHIPEIIAWKKAALEFGVTLPDDWTTQLDTVTQNAIVEVKGMREIVQSYRDKGYSTAVFSNIDSRHAETIRKLGCYNGFNTVVLSCEIGVDKPDPNAYKVMLEKVNVDPKNCIFIDNKQENVDAAKALGIDAILFTSPEQIKTDLAKRLK